MKKNINTLVIPAFASSQGIIRGRLLGNPRPGNGGGARCGVVVMVAAAAAVDVVDVVFVMGILCIMCYGAWVAVCMVCMGWGGR